MWRSRADGAWVHMGRPVTKARGWQHKPTTTSTCEGPGCSMTDPVIFLAEGGTRTSEANESQHAYATSPKAASQRLKGGSTGLQSERAGAKGQPNACGIASLYVLGVDVVTSAMALGKGDTENHCWEQTPRKLRAAFCAARCSCLGAMLYMWPQPPARLCEQSASFRPILLGSRCEQAISKWPISSCAAAAAPLTTAAALTLAANRASADRLWQWRPF